MDEAAAQFHLRRRHPAHREQRVLAAERARQLRFYGRGDAADWSTEWPVPGTGSDFADFLLGIPDTSSIAFGNADKYFRSTNYDLYFTDDWRVNAGLTINAGVRWDYGSPITEKYGRLVNLDVVPGFAAEAPVVANRPTGTLTGQTYPDSLVHPDKHGFQPRIGMSLRPIFGSSLVIRAGYGVNYNTSVYNSIVSQMAQQSPLSKSLSVQNTPDNPLTLANGFNATPGITPNTFAVDPNFRIGYAQNWQISVQQDLPAAMIATVTYLGIKGTRAVQAFYPNTYPDGRGEPLPLLPVGVRVHGVERQLDARGGPVSIAPPHAQRHDGERAVRLFEIA